MFNIAEFAKLVGLPYMTVYNHMKRGYCRWPRKVNDGITQNSAYKCWENMIQRCTNPKAIAYFRYGGRGITVDPTWVNNFRLFIEHIGPRPSKYHSIDRINNSIGYIPGNVRWATAKKQANNKRGSRGGGDGIDKHGRYYRFVYQGEIQKYLTWEEAAEAKDNLYGRGNW